MTAKRKIRVSGMFVNCRAFENLAPAWCITPLLPAILFVTVLIFAFPIQSLQAQERKPAPVTRIAWLTDPSRELELADILTMGEEAGFVALGGNSVNFGYTRDAVWLKIEIESDTDREVLLSLVPNFVDMIDVFVGRDGPDRAPDSFDHMGMGDHRPLQDDAMSGLDHVVPVNLVAGETALVYIRIASVSSSLTLTAAVYSPTHHTLRTTISGLAIGVWFGGMAVLLVIQLVFFQFDRKPYYALLAFSTFMAMLVYTGTLGLSRLFLFPNGGPGNDFFTAATSWFGLTASTLAGASILELRRTAPWLNRVFLAGAGIGVIGVGFAAAGANLVFADFAGMVIIALATLGAIQGLRTAGDVVGGWLRASAFCALWVGLIATISQRSGIGPLPNWVSHGYAVSALVQTILLTGALGVRLRAAETLNNIMREQALAAAREAEQRANALVEERTGELAAAKQVAEEALNAELASQEEQVRFMEVISHQYRTPLAAIRSHVDNIGLSLPREDDANRRRLDRVRRGIARLVEVLEVNLSRSRFQGSAFRPKLARTPIAGIVDSAAARARDLLQHPIITEIGPDAEDARIMADADMLGVAVINLLENAVKFSAGRSKAPVVLSCVVLDGKAVISVSDKGIGIPQDEIASVLGRSVRGSNAVSIEGSGAGLSLVSRIAATHGGTVEIESALGKGTTVRIVLPSGDKRIGVAISPREKRSALT